MPKTGRPSKYTPELAAEICRRLAEGESLRAICRDDGMPDKETVRRWLMASPEFRAHYARAREDQADELAEQTLAIADEGVPMTPHGMDAAAVQDKRLRMDARRWFAGKVAPRKYGDKVQQEISGPDGGPVQTKYVLEVVMEPTPTPRRQIPPE